MRVEEKIKRAIEHQKIDQINELFNDVYLDYYKLVYFIIAKYVSTKEDIEELVDNVFVNLYNRLKTTPIDNIKYYLVVSSKNISINFIKKQKIEYIELNENFVYNVEYDSSNDKYYEIIYDMKHILSDYEIEIILQHVIYDKTFEDISTMYNKPLKTIYSTYSRSIKKYRKYKRGKQHG